MTKSHYGSTPELIRQHDLEWDEFMHYMYLPIFIRAVGTAVPPRLAFTEKVVMDAMHQELIVRGNSWDYVYLTARRGYATPGNPLNRPGWHADGFGTDDINYVWTDRYPTLFALQRFDDISDDHAVSARQFEEQIAEATAANDNLITTYGDRWLMRLDSSVIHAAPEIPEPGGVRSFLKVSFSNDKYNLRGNSHNYELDYEWTMYSREALRNDPARSDSDSVSEV